MKVVYICAPYRGDVKGNTEVALRYAQMAIEYGCVPLVPHVQFPYLDDSDAMSRSLALFMDLQLLDRCDELWICGEKGVRTEGMKLEIAYARDSNISVKDRRGMA